MNEEKQKKIRTQLINFMNKELIRNKKLKKSNFLINSMTLEQLEKKNMQCKDFYVKEKDKIYQNIDNGWIIGLNIYVNNLSNHNPFIYCLSNAIKDNYILNNIKNKTDIHINQINNINNNKETIIQKQSNKILFIQKEGNMGSPVDTSLLIKKELGDRKLKRKNHEFNSNKIPIHFSDRLLNIDNIEKEIEKDNDKKKENNIINNIDIINDIDENIKLTKQLSNETLETEISRIIKICHDDRYTNSFEHFPSDSKISELSKEIKIAKMYAKKLKSYCRTLKRKNPLNHDDKFKKKRSEISTINCNNSLQIYENNSKNKNKDNLLKKDENNKEKNKIKKYKKLLTINSKKNLEKNKEDHNQLEHLIPKKKIKSQRNLKLKIKTNSFLYTLKEIEKEKKNYITSSLNTNEFQTLEQRKNKKRLSLFKLSKNKSKKTFEQEYKSNPKLKIKKELIKSSQKIINNKRNKKSNKNGKIMRDIIIKTDKSLNYQDKKRKTKEKINEIIKNKILPETNKEHNSKKLIRFKRHLDEFHKKRKSSNINPSKPKNEKRSSLDTQFNIRGFEKLNFLKIKTRSTQEQFLFNNKNKKKNKGIRLSNNINNANISQQRDSSPSIEKTKKHNKKHNSKPKNISNSRLKFRDKRKKQLDF